MSIRIHGLLAAGLLAVSAQAATLKLADGGTATVAVAPPRPGSVSSALPALQLLVYTISETDGRSWSGTVPGTEGTGASDFALAQNPVGGDLVLAFARPGSGGRDLLATGWSGDSWLPAQGIATSSADDHAPLLAFRRDGDALLAWSHDTRLSSDVLLLHFDAQMGSNLTTYDFMDVGDVVKLAGDASTTLVVAPRVLDVVGASESLAAYLLVGSPDRSPMSVVRVGLDAIVNPGGFGAAPVPVSYVRTSAQGMSSGGGLTGRVGVQPGVGEIFAPWRIVLGHGEAWYWTDGTRAQEALFTAGSAPALVGFDDPHSDALLHVEAYRIARAAFGDPLRAPSSPALPIAPSRRTR